MHELQSNISSLGSKNSSCQYSQLEVCSMDLCMQTAVWLCYWNKVSVHKLVLLPAGCTQAIPTAKVNGQQQYTPGLIRYTGLWCQQHALSSHSSWVNSSKDLQPLLTQQLWQQQQLYALI